MQTYTILTVIAISYLSMGYFEVRNISKYMKEYSIEELKKIMPANSIKLKQMLENQ